MVPITKPIFERIIQEGAVPAYMYYFTIFQIVDDNEYSQEKVGLFGNLETCQKFETQYQEVGEGTGRCREWEDPLKQFKKNFPDAK